jgi:carbonic anhydrase/acetyltransferase-like protein (isoleucine patch superfamily)|tara:strand:+ start:47380 stop:47925 length:546 start_codon:yes stop_codon:yes gene_type:complete
MPTNLRAFNGIQPKLGNNTYIDPAATVIGEVELGDDVSIWPGAVLRGDMHWIRIGDRSNVQDNAVIHTTHASEQFNPAGFPTSIGKDVTIGHSSVLHGCTIEDKVLVGIGAIINDGVTIKSGAMVGAGALVPPGKTLEGGFIYVGNPARQLRPLSDSEKTFLGYSPQNYIKLKNQYIADQE